MIDLLRVLIVPGKVFASLRTRIPLVLPLAVLTFFVLVFGALQGWFISDEEYLRIHDASLELSSEWQEQIAEILGRTPIRRDMSEEEFEETMRSHREQTEEIMETLTSEKGIHSLRKVQTFFGPMSMLCTLAIVLLLEATYFLIAGNMMKCSKQWSDWIGFSLWTSMPLVIFLLLATLPTVWAGVYDPYGLQAPLRWIPGLETNAFALTLTVPVVWTVWIRSVGMHKWIEKPMPLCFIIALIPAIVGWLIEAGQLHVANPYTML
ncbi:MAG: hypothetical protein F4Z01_09610 [Gammaproteobacteria bacterium]|nr:hypothetical protein [Gammaproteobacteria bacterium]MYF38421.1 hypothetical protein [Gammaproteobacteria bacterium]